MSPDGAWTRFVDLCEREDVQIAAQAVFLAWHAFSVLVMLAMGLSGRWPWWTLLMAGVVVVCWVGMLAAYMRRRARDAEEDEARAARVDAMRAGSEERLDALRAGFEAAKREDGPIFEKVEACVRMERRFQRSRYGDDTHPEVAASEVGVDVELDAGLAGEDLVRARVARAHGIPEAWVAQRLSAVAFKEGRGTWAHLLVEEVCEAVEAAASPRCHCGCAPLEVERELYQVAAVAMAWAEDSRRRRGDGADAHCLARPEVEP